MERLSFLGPQRVMTLSFPNKPTIRVEAHGLTRREADGLVKMFGGQLSEAKWLTAVNPPERPPIRIRQKLLIVSTERERAAAATDAARAVVLIPAGMAFGTGEHDTTVTCLRLLADVSQALRTRRWEALDLGTGSGILAIAARQLGSVRVEACDYDPHAVRTAKENVRANLVRGIKVSRLDVRAWEPARTWEVVMANLFSGLHLEVAAKVVRAIKPGGRLIFSGILREQEEEVVAEFRRQGIRVERLVRKGKWVTGLASVG